MTREGAPGDAPPAEHRIHVAAEGFEAPLLDELARALPGSAHRPRGTGFVESDLAPPDAAAAPTLAFARQTLPAAEELSAPSIARFADALFERLDARLGGHDGPWRLHVFCRDVPGADARTARCARIDEAVVALLKKKRRALLRRRAIDPSPRLAPDEALAQLALETGERGFFSFAGPAKLARLRRCVSRFPGGIVEVADDPEPPSRAYRKLLEAEARLGDRISAGERCVDLGASPGGWTHVALARGARVVAVDRSPLAPALMAHPLLEFVKGDAFRHAPAAPVDWLLSDVVAFPGRVIELIDAWVGARRCLRFVVTVKFRGADDYPALARLEAILLAHGADFAITRLCNNKNEVTAYGTSGPAR